MSRNLYSFLLITFIFLFLPMEFPQDIRFISHIFFETSLSSFLSPSLSLSKVKSSSLLVSAGCGKKCKKHVVAIETKKVIPVPVPYPVYPKKKKKCCKKKGKNKAIVVTVPDKCCKNKGCCGGFANYGYNYYDYIAPPLFYDYSYYDYYGGGVGGLGGVGGGFGGGVANQVTANLQSPVFPQNAAGNGFSFTFGKKKKK